MAEDRDLTGPRAGDLTEDEKDAALTNRYLSQLQPRAEAGEVDKYVAQLTPPEAPSQAPVEVEQPPRATTDTLQAFDGDLEAVGAEGRYGGPNEYEELLAHMQNRMRKSGRFTDGDIAAVFSPYGTYEGEPPTEDVLNEMYKFAQPIMEANREDIVAAHRWWQELSEGREDMEKDRQLNWSAMRMMTEVYGQETLAFMGGFQRFLRTAARDIAADTAQYKSMHQEDLSAGMGLLDLAARAMNAFRIRNMKDVGVLDAEEEFNIKAEFLPPVVTRNPRTGEERQFSTQISANWHLNLEKLKAQVTLGGLEVMGWYHGLMGARGREEAPEGTITEHDRAKIEQRNIMLDAAELMPQVSASHVPPLQGTQALEGSLEPDQVAALYTDPYLTMLGMSMSEEERQALIAKVQEEGDYWPLWDAIEQAGWVGDYTIGELTTFNTLTEVGWDPLLAAGTLPSKAVRAMRAGMGLVAPGAKARVLSRVARNTNDPVEALESVAAAKKLRDVRKAAADKAAEANGGMVPQKELDELLQAERALVVEEDWARNFTREMTDDELLHMRRSGRRTPEFMPDPKKKVYHVRENVPKQGPNTMEQAVEEITTHKPAEWREVKKKFKEEELVDKSPEELDFELAEWRKREAVRQNDWVIAYDEDARLAYEADATTVQRQVLGPDDMEQGGDALNHVVRTGGLGIDDVTVTPPNVAYSWDPVKVASQFEWGLIDDVTKTERELGISRGAKPTDVGTSAMRSQARHIDRIGKALGANRRLGNKARVAILEKEHRQAKATLAKLRKKLSSKQKKEFRAETKATKKLRKERDQVEFDERWVGGQPNSLRKEGKLAQFVNDMPYWMTRGMYGDSFHMLTRTKFGQMFGHVRDPLRWLQTHDPQAAEHMRLSYARYERDTQRYEVMFHNILKKSGVMKEASKGKAIKQAAKSKGMPDWVIDQDRSEMLFDLLDSRKGSGRHVKAAKRITDAGADELFEAHNAIRAVMDDFADRQGLTGTAKYLQGYMRHVITGEEFTRGARPLEFLGLSGKAEVIVRHLLRRKGLKGKYSKDLPAILDLYNRASFRKVHLEPMFFDMKKVGKRLGDKYGHTIPELYMKATVDNLQGRASFLGKGIDAVVGKRKTADGKVVHGKNRIERALTGFATLFWMSSIPFNPRYALMQMTAGVTTTGSRLGLMRTSRGMLSMMTKEGHMMAKELGFYDTVTQMMESNTLRTLADQAGEISGITHIEAVVRGASAHAARDMLMNKYGFTTWAEVKAAGAHHRIMFESMRLAENANHMFGPLARSPWINRFLGQPAGTAISQFTLYPLKQTEELLAMASKNPGYVAQYFAMSGYINRIFAQHLGYDVTKWTGAGFVDEIVKGNTESPFHDFLTKWQDVAVAMEGGDATLVERTMTQVMQSMQTLIPVLLRDSTKMAERWSSGRQIDSKGRFVRELFLGENDRLLEKVAEGLDPTLLDNPTRELDPRWKENKARRDPARGLGGDFAPTIMMGPAIRDRVQQITTSTLFQQKQRHVQGARHLMNKLADALEADDQYEVARLAEELFSRYALRIAPEALEDKWAAIQDARVISKNLRWLEENPRYIDRFFDLTDQTGAGIGMDPKSVPPDFMKPKEGEQQ